MFIQSCVNIFIRLKSAFIDFDSFCKWATWFSHAHALWIKLREPFMCQSLLIWLQVCPLEVWKIECFFKVSKQDQEGVSQSDEDGINTSLYDQAFPHEIQSNSMFPKSSLYFVSHFLSYIQIKPLHKSVISHILSSTNPVKPITNISLAEIFY